jgi:hypothetical protein
MVLEVSKSNLTDYKQQKDNCLTMFYSSETLILKDT